MQIFIVVVFFSLDLKMLGNLVLISLTLIFFNGCISLGLETAQLDSIDVLETLKKKVPDCQIRMFVKSDKDHQKLTDDLKTYCSTTKEYALLCQMMAYELEKACQLPSTKRPSPALYDIKADSSDICTKGGVESTDQWIAQKLSNQEKKITIDSKNLCQQVTTDAKTIHLARFFYKIAPRVRKSDSSDPNKGQSS